MGQTMKMLILLTVMAVMMVPTGAQNARHRNIKDAMRNITNQIRRCARTSAISYAMLDITKGFAYQGGVDDNGALSSSTVFCIGDSTQAFSAVLLGMLIDGNPNVTWDTPVEQIIGRHTPLPDLYRTKNLNLKDIFSMRSGLSGLDIVPWAQPYDQAALISRLRYAPVVAGFREKYIHNNVLFALVQEATEALGGDTWFNLMRSYIFERLEMRDASFLGPTMASLRNSRAPKLGTVRSHQGRPYALSEATYDGLEMIAPAASMCASAQDMHRWMQFLLLDGHKDNQEFIRATTLQMLYEGIQPRGHDNNPKIRGYKNDDTRKRYVKSTNSIGFINGQYHGNNFISQDGSLPGYQTLATIIPDKKRAVYVALSGDESPKNQAAKTLLNMVALNAMENNNGYPWLRTEEVCNTLNRMVRQHRDQPAFVLEDAPRGSNRRRPMSDYAATYKNWAFGDVEVKYNASGNGALSLTYGTTTYRLDSDGRHDIFKMVAINGSLWYTTNANWYSDNNDLYAVFNAREVRRADDDENGDDEEDEEGEAGQMREGEKDDNDDGEDGEREERVVSVMIPAFDSHSNPVFAINARRPFYEREVGYPHCSAPRSLMSSACGVAFLAISVVSLISVYFR